MIIPQIYLVNMIFWFLMPAKRICFVITDAVSFNVLCRDQLEYFRDEFPVDLTLVCGGGKEQLNRLHDRNVGRVVDIGFVRKPSLYNDFVSLCKLFVFFVLNRFDLVVYSTPKALLLGSIASFFSIQPRRIALIRGRVYENYHGVKRVAFRLLDAIALYLSNKVIFISKSLKDAFVKEGLVSGSKSIVLGAGSSNGVDISLACCEKKTADEKIRFRLSHGFLPDDYLVVMVGRICRDKGISDLSEVVSRISNPRVKFVVVGDFEDEFSERMISSLLNQSRRLVRIPSVVNVFEIFQLADLHIFLSHREGFGNVAVEAAATGLPTVAYNVVGVRDSVRQGVSGVRFPLGDYLSVANFIDYAAAHPTLISDNFSGASEWARVNFDRKIVWDNYMRFYIKECNS